jgi:DNA-directed RNA polymerase specialized sigma24 family protein
MRPHDWSSGDHKRDEAIASEILNSLPPREADVIMRYYHDGQTETEIEQATGFTLTEQQQLRHRVRMDFFARLYSRENSSHAQ